MSTETTKEKPGSRVPLWNPDAEDASFLLWSVQMEAYASINDWEFTTKRDPDLPTKHDEVIDESTEDGKKKKKALERNKKGIAALALAMQTVGDIGLLLKTRSPLWPQGLMYEFAVALYSKYQPQDIMTKTELRMAINKITMSLKMDPKKLFTQISMIENKYVNAARQGQIDKEEWFAVVLEKAPKEYTQGILTTMDAKGNNCSLKDLEDSMGKLWRAKYKSLEESEEDEFGLSAFQGKCNNCGEAGHKERECNKPRLSNKKQRGRDNRNKKFKGKCHQCGKTGHKKVDCWQLESNASKRPPGFRVQGSTSEQAAAAMSAGTGVEFLLCATEMEFPSAAAILNDPNVWVADTAASTHMTPFDDGMVNKRKAVDSDSIRMGNKQVEKTSDIGDIYGTLHDKHGNRYSSKVGMKDVSYVPSAGYNLFSLSRMIDREGWTLGGNKDAITIKKGNHVVKFDIKISTEKGAVYAAYFKRDTEIAGAAQMKPVKMNVSQAHRKLGHMNEEMTRKTAKELEIVVTQGGLGPCDSCAAGKAKQKNLPRTEYDDMDAKKDESVRRAFTDIASVKVVSNKPRPPRPHWRIIVIDEDIQMKISDFFKTKNGMVEPTLEKFNKWNQAGIGITHLRLDNAGENKLLKKRSESAAWKMNIKFEFTARDTPQQNSIAEVAIATIANRGRAMMHDANLGEKERYLLYDKAFGTATKLDGLVPVTINGVTQSRYMHWYGQNPTFSLHLRTWGEAGTVKIKTDTTPKVNDKGVHCMFVGYADDHAGDVYEMWDPKTKRIHKTRDVIWLKRMFYEKPKDKKEFVPRIELYDEDQDQDVPQDESVQGADSASVGKGTQGNSNAEQAQTQGLTRANAQTNQNSGTTVAEPQAEVEPVQQTTTTRSGRSVRPSTRLIEEIGDLAVSEGVVLTNAEIHYYQALESCANEFAMIGAGIGGGFDSTEELHVMKYDEAMEQPDKEKWVESVKDEKFRMDNNEVFEETLIDNVPKDAKILTSTWAMKKKANGTYRARLNARGFEQVDGEHYDEARKSAPVVAEATIRIVLILMIMAGWVGELMDVKGAFLCGTFEDEHQMYMYVPQGWEEYYPPNVVLLLKKTIYGLKQAARAFWKRLCEAFKNMSFKRSKADPCLHFAWTILGLILWLSWVDDLFTTGNAQGVKKAKMQMKEHFECDDQGEMQEYVGCKIERNWEEGWIRLTQPVLLQSFVDEFELPEHDDLIKTPAAPGEILQNGEPMSSEKQAKYRSGVGKLIHLVKKTRPEMLNSVRELTRFMSKPTECHMKAMYRAMNHAVDTRNRGVLLRPNAKWDGSPDFEFEINGKADATYASDPETKRSVSGYSTFLNGAPVTEKSRMQNCVTLSVTEAEFVSGTQCAQDMLFEMRVLESIGLKVKKPMILEIDNKGAVDLSHNWSVNGRTRHVAIRMSFLRELEEDGVLKVKWTKGENNSADMFTKNLPGPAYERHAVEYVGMDEYMDA